MIIRFFVNRVPGLHYEQLKVKQPYCQFNTRETTDPVFIECLKHETSERRSIAIRKPLLIDVTKYLQIHTELNSVTLHIPHCVKQYILFLQQ